MLKNIYFIFIIGIIFQLFAANPQQEEKKYQSYNRFPRMMQAYLVDQVIKIEQEAKQRLAALKSKSDVEAYIRDVRQKIQLCFGDWPEKTPLNPRITGVVERDVYKIENVIFESRPNFLVTANLYIPKGRKFPLPAVIGTCGHSDNGKASSYYQSFSQGLARQGYVVLIYDPIGQGERLQYPDKNLKSKIRPGTGEHLHAGNQQFLVGEFLGSWRAWDGIRALDYLLTRKEVDPNFIGITGNSGGGTMTTWLCGVEDRWTMAAPSCFVTTMRRNIENEESQDTEQCPPLSLGFGLDHSDFLAALAPKPIIILAKEKDFFDVRGSEEAYERLKRLYSLLGQEDKIGYFAGPTYHGYSQENREAMYNWFNKFTGISPIKREPELIIENDSTLWCTEKGQVSTLGSRTVQSFTKEISQKLAQERKKNTSESEYKENLIQLLKLPEKIPETIPEFRIFRAHPARGFPKDHWTTYAVETEPGIFAVVYTFSEERMYSRPTKSNGAAIVYISHLSSDAELREEPLVKELLQKEPMAKFYACDVRGIGESRPNTGRYNSFFNAYGNDYFYAITSFMLDKPYVGQKTYDVLQIINWVKSFGHQKIHLVGKGWGSIPATFAAILSDKVTHITLKNALTSYSDIAENEFYDWPLSTFVPNILKYLDLPDCYSVLKNKKLVQIEPWRAEY
jgi:cephalosporin-C deacetylase-like acetyl esterase